MIRAQFQFGLCLTLTLGLLGYLLWTPAVKSPAIAGAGAPPESAVRLTATGEIEIQPDCPLHRRLELITAKPERISAPALNVTGTVVASLAAKRGKGRAWQFSSPELLTMYTDWQKAIADVAFARTQLDSIRELADNRVRAQGAQARRLEKLVEAGTDTEKDLAAARTELLQSEIQGRKDTHEAESALRLARRTEAALARQLEQAGVDPELLRLATSEAARAPRPAPAAVDVDIVVADVPEALVGRVKLGQGCEARFFGVTGKLFSGNVRAISPVLSRERRSLRVLFSIDDPDDLLRPGMFADIGLGTDAREALLVPLAGVVHVGRTDYLLVRGRRRRTWRATPVQVGELHSSGAVEILRGLRAGEEVVSKGAILLKPLIAEAVQEHASRGPGGS